MSISERFNKCKSGASKNPTGNLAFEHMCTTQRAHSVPMSHNSFSSSHIVSDLVTQKINLQVLCLSPVRLDLNVFQIQKLYLRSISLV